MPARKRFRRGVRRRRFRRKFRRVFRRRKTRIQKITKKRIRSVPDKVFLRLKYADNLTGTVGIGAQSVSPYWLNGIYDPYQPVGGHQPRLFDQWTQFYYRYHVTASKIRIKAWNTGGTSTALMEVAVLPDYSNTSLGNYTSMWENQYARVAWASAASGGGRPASVKNFMKTSKLVGAPVYGNPNFEAVYNNSPAEACYWIIVVQEPTATVAINYVAQVHITYYVEMRARNQLGPS